MGRIAVIIGTSGGIGAVLVEHLAGDARYAGVLVLSRGATAPCCLAEGGAIDVTDEMSIAAAAARARPLGKVRPASGGHAPAVPR